MVPRDQQPHCHRRAGVYQAHWQCERQPDDAQQGQRAGQQQQRYPQVTQPQKRRWIGPQVVDCLAGRFVEQADQLITAHERDDFMPAPRRKFRSLHDPLAFDVALDREPEFVSLSPVAPACPALRAVDKTPHLDHAADDRFEQKHR